MDFAAEAKRHREMAENAELRRPAQKTKAYALKAYDLLATHEARVAASMKNVK